MKTPRGLVSTSYMPSSRRALAHDNICSSLEVHAQATIEAQAFNSADIKFVELGS